MFFKLSDVLDPLLFGVAVVGVATGLSFDLVELVNVWTEEPFFELAPVKHLVDFDDNVTVSYGSLDLWSTPCASQSSLIVGVMAWSLLLTLGTLGKDQLIVELERKDWNVKLPRW